VHGCAHNSVNGFHDQHLSFQVQAHSVHGFYDQHLSFKMQDHSVHGFHDQHLSFQVQDHSVHGFHDQHLLLIQIQKLIVVYSSPALNTQTSTKKGQITFTDLVSFIYKSHPYLF